MRKNPLLAALALALLLRPATAHALFCPLGTEDASRRIVACKDGVSLEDCRRIAEGVGCSVVRTLASINAIVITVPKQGLQSAEQKLRVMAEVSRVDDDPRVNWLKAVGARAEWTLPSPKDLLKPFMPVPKPKAAPDAEQPWGIRRVNAAGAWAKSQGKGVKVAIIDTGIDFTHPDLAGRVAGGFNAVDPKKPQAFKDDQGHGTHVAGTIAALRDGKGVAGVAPLASLYAVKVLDADGNGNFSDVIAGIEWAAKNKMDVANMSLGADEGNESLRLAVIAAEKAGVVIVAAAGNNSGGPVSFPGIYPQTIAVAASDPSDKFASFSSKGAEVDLIAPGEAINSTKMDGGYEELSGTSMAAPHVAGLAALAVASGSHGLAQVKKALEAAASALKDLPTDQQGKGLPDAAKLTR